MKRLELDIDRASWVVEMAMEWQAEKGSEIPRELIERLTRNLFEKTERPELVKHPIQDLTSSLLGASSGLRVNIPGLGEVRLNRRGIRRFQRATEETTSAEE